jgi:multidrug efflux pump subunit AcrB
MNNGRQSNAASVFVVLKDWSVRKKKSESAAAVVERFNRQAYVEIEEAQCFAFVPPAIPGIGNVGGLQLQLEDRKALGLTEMQKLLGKAKFEELLGNLVHRPQGKPTLVPESDKRPAITTAKADFIED